MPYLPLDPADLGRSYEAVIRINSQSGKGGIAYVLEADHGLVLPRRLQIEFGKIVQQRADGSGKELSSAEIWDCFRAHYLDVEGRIALLDHRILPDAHASERRVLTASLRIGGECAQIEGRGTGAIDAFVVALNAAAGLTLAVVDYHEHALGAGADANAVAYVEVRSAEGTSTFGVGLHKDIVTASLRALVSAANRLAHSRAAKPAR